MELIHVFLKATGHGGQVSVAKKKGSPEWPKPTISDNELTALVISDKLSPDYYNLCV